MKDHYTEAAYEAAIEHYLLTYGGYTRADPDTFDRVRGLDPTVLLPFIQEAQPEEWDYLENLQGDRAEETLLDNLCQALNSEYEGCLMVLRHGFKCFGRLFRVAHFRPASGLNPETQRLYAANRLTVTRQLRYSDKHGKTLDLVLSLNGLPIATAELKNPMTGQTWHDAVAQYQNDRDPRLASPPAHLATRRSGRKGVRLYDGGHRPAGARPVVAEHHLPVRAQTGRGAEDRPGFSPTCGSAGCRSAHRHHHPPEVPLRHQEDRRSA